MSASETMMRVHAENIIPGQQQQQHHADPFEAPEGRGGGHWQFITY